MGKIKGLLEDYNDYHGYPIDIDEAALWEYHQMRAEEAHQEELIRQGKASYQMNTEEAESYNLYMEGKLCGEQPNTVHTNSGTNLKDGRSSTGESATLKYRKRRSAE